MKIIRKNFDDWDDKTRKRLQYATLICGHLKLFMQTFPQSPTIVIFARKQVMGWAFVLRNTHNNTPFINLFVNKRYRKHGLATLLVKEALKDFPMISLTTWNNETQRLFRELRERYPGRIIVFSWSKNIHKYDKLLGL